LFGHYSNGFDTASVVGDVEKGWRSGIVIIPKTVVNELIVPNPFASPDV